MKTSLLSKIVLKAMVIKGRFDLKTMHKNAEKAVKNNDDLLMEILSSNAGTEYGRKYDFASIHSPEEYQKKVPLSVFEDYIPYLDRINENGEKNLLTAKPILGYAQTSGTSGTVKFIPITQNTINVYTRYTLTIMMALADEECMKKYGRHLKLGRGMGIMPDFMDILPNGLPCSNIADVAAKQLGFLYRYILDIPFKDRFTFKDIDFKYACLRFALEDEDCSFMYAIFFKMIAEMIDYLKVNWEVIIDDIEKGTISDTIYVDEEIRKKLEKIVKPNPERAKTLRAEFEKGFDGSIVKRIWPNMSAICGIGTASFKPYADFVRKYAEDVPFIFSIYGASEGLFASVDEAESDKQLLLVDSCYYEFIDVEDQSNRILTIKDLEVDKEYEIIITNQSGLYRYQAGDVIKVLDMHHDCPYIVFAYRKGYLLNINGEKTTEKHVAEIVHDLENEKGITVSHWAVHVKVEEFPNRYELLLENKDGLDLTVYEDYLEKKLCETNPRYDYFRKCEGDIGPLKVYNQLLGTHDAWNQEMINNGAAEAQIKPVFILDNKKKEDFFLSRIK